MKNGFSSIEIPPNSRCEPPPVPAGKGSVRKVRRSYCLGEFFQGDQPPLKFEPIFARWQIDLQNSRIRRETEPGPVRRKIDRKISLPIDRATVTDGRRDDANQPLPLFSQERRKKD